LIQVISGQMKVGNFTLAFSDLMTPAAGLRIEMIRSYDSRDKRAGDFGADWHTVSAIHRWLFCES
jgi:hypothetical protein